MSGILPSGHRHRGSGLPLDALPMLEQAIIKSRHKGAIWYVDSAKTSGTAGSGTSWDDAVLTIQQAINKCSANDLVLVAPGHAESIGDDDECVLSVSGVSVVGLGSGEKRPILTFSTATDASIVVSGANVTLANFVLKNNVDAQVCVVDVNADDCTLEDLELREGSSKQYLVGIDVNGGAANAADRCKIRRCRITSITAGAAAGIELGEVADEVEIEDCLIDGDFSDAGIHNPTGKILTNLLVDRNIVRNRQTGDHAIELVSACTGMAIENRLFADIVGAVFDSGSLLCSGNTQTSNIDSSEAPSPVGGTDFAPGLGYRVAKTEDGATATGDDLFTVTGLVRITSWVMQVTNALGATAKFSDYKVGTATVDYCAATDISSAIVGYTVQLNNDSGATLLAQSTGAVSVADHCDQNSFPSCWRPVGRLGLGTAVTLKSTRTAGDAGDAIVHIVHYIPMEPGANIVAAA